MLHMILLDSAIEVIPAEIRSLKPIQQYCSRRKKRPNTVLLDQSRHGQAMVHLPDQERRGRPDIAFLTLMGLLETPLCKAGLLTIHLHLQDGRIIEIRPDVRLPRHYDRFIGLLEQLLTVGRVPPTGEPLLRIIDLTLPELLTSLKAEHTDAQVFLASENGTPTTLHDLVDHFPIDPSLPVIFGVGAFPHGDVDPSIATLFDKAVSLDSETMMTWHVCSEILWLYSYRLKLGSSRFT
ncbi:MAG: hypothetical protein K9W43_01005 [Candidatus Thorarchaeota archaeon]|nr:hypothetical protein [Candidatus Thorarchaeota archaeon]